MAAEEDRTHVFMVERQTVGVPYRSPICAFQGEDAEEKSAEFAEYCTRNFSRQAEGANGERYQHINGYEAVRMRSFTESEDVEEALIVMSGVID